MKKFLSLFLIMVTLLVQNCVLSAEPMQNMIFDMDISEYTNDTKKITDKSRNDISVNTTKCNAALTESSEPGDPARYLDFKGGVTEENGNFANFYINNIKELVPGEMTVEIWAKPTVTAADVEGGNNRVLFSVSIGNKSNSTFNATFTDSKLVVSVNGKETSCDVSEYMNKWSQFTATRSYNASEQTATVTVYINSKKVINTTFTDTVYSDEEKHKFYVGAYGNIISREFSTMFIGGLSEARIYNGILSDADIQGNYFLQVQNYIVKPEEVEPNIPDVDSGVIFDLSVGTKISELADVSVSNVAIETAGGVRIEQYEGMDGAISYVKTNNNNELQNISFISPKIINNEKTSYEFYIKVPEQSAEGVTVARPFVIYSNEKKTPLFFEIRSDGGASIGRTEKGIEEKMISTQGLDYRTKGDWVYVVITRNWDSKMQKLAFTLYINGEKAGAAVLDEILSVGDADGSVYYVGGMPSYGTDAIAYGYNGGFSEIRIYNKELTASDIAEKYSSSVRKYTAKADSDIFELVGKTEISKVDTSLTFAVSGAEILSDIKVTDVRTGEEISAEVTSAEDGFTISFGQYLKYGQELKFYSPSLQKYEVKTVSKGTSEVNAKVYNSNSVEINKPNASDSYKVMLEIKNSGTSPMNYKYSVLAKDELSAAICFESGNVTLASGVNDRKLINLNGTKTANEIQIFVWEDFEGKLIPVYAVPIVIK